MTHYAALLGMAAESIDWNVDRLTRLNWDVNHCPGCWCWTDLCRAIGNWVIYAHKVAAADLPAAC